MLSPKRTKFRKAHKGRVHGLAKGGTSLNFGAFGLKAMQPGRITARQIEAARRAAGYLSVPGRQKLAADLLFTSAHHMWRWAGDTATDYNYYSKRLILSGVITATRLYWFDDSSDDFANTRAFLERRIENVMQFEKVKAKAKNWSEKMHGDKAPFDGIIGALAKMRYRQN